MSDPVLRVEDLTVQYGTRGGSITAVSDASFTIEEGEYFGLVGESGCGKSTIARSVIGGLDDNGRIASGSIYYRDKEISSFGDRQYNEEVRWKEISYIPQSSMNSLDPLQRIDQKVLEVAKAHTDLTREEALDRFRDLLDVVGISETRMTDYPHQFSGGMQQRVIIALALFLNPSLLIADEPTTALDVIMQDQIFKYLDRIKEETDTSVMLITHDISVVFESCDSMAVMHGGQIAETGAVTSLFDTPLHPYSIMLQKAFPDLRHPNADLETIDGTPPQMMGEVTSCTFADRCPLATAECRERAPTLEPADVADVADVAGDRRHAVSCFHADRTADLRETRPNPSQ